MSGKDKEEDSMQKESTNFNSQGNRLLNNILNQRKLNFSKKSKLVITGLIIGLILIILHSLFSKMQSNPATAVESLKTAISRDDRSEVKNLIKSSNKSQHINEDDIEILIQYLKNHHDYSKGLFKELSSQADKLASDSDAHLSSKYFMNLKPAEKKYGIFPDYKILVKPAYITIKSKVKGTNIYINNKQVGTSTSDDFTHTYGPYMPGIYTVKESYRGNYAKVDKVVKVDTTKNTEVKNIDSVKYVNVTSENEDAEVFIDNKNIGKKIKDVKTLGPITNNTKIYAVAVINGKQYKSEEKEIGGEYNKEETPKLYLDFPTYPGVPNPNGGQVQQLIKNYLVFKCVAVNTGNLGAMNSYIYPGSELSDEVKALVKKYQSKDEKITTKSCNITGCKFNQDGKSGVVNTEEVYNVDKYGVQSTKEYNCSYSFKFNGKTNTYLVYKLLESVSR
ncbi:putative membrane protein YvbJ [Clostridium acetobutylicum]|uniref:Membrane-associated protein TcaA n=1 Tax=Clostridium acetobutylicum (strain ATCC 824 / DSM 792 / JCM 1419 / IAM 19013 / LMG 5710 / NBRC 13948 / NRRL B-527 / VKM B-1787 / 2291 / W) TaxID=272562 RepID=Q97E80_CLOAB|nr:MULTISPECIES: zinc ribbon domain-containing protein [Clostridium]AAK81170.1 Uncharacterized conserved protein, YVBJ B.subtilis homolog [Clostridium acetobutylicum ATCC 824]ADZ22275.1 Conserved hypothetical protein [Clostridium acetobutylicum EA 2018]AEI34693.1 hypothetical protein SMB_G3271 [Clostridium acetobutylicum DSM 1731]AWV81162.1 zinc ribbon domain-containing protein [Clostridium acetobutylicum]MBC2395636.1 zinc ribbon domain-containing protein [Clostridium acetobutylicum]